MIILNFSHPLTDIQQAQIEALTGHPIAKTHDIPAQFDNALPFAGQIRDLVDGIDLTSGEWQTMPILVNPPSYHFAAVTLLAELHGRMGYFPAMVRIRPVVDRTPPGYEVAEIINLQAVRQAARTTR